VIIGDDYGSRRRKRMLPRNIPVLEGKDAEKFISQDKKRLSSAEQVYLEKCRAIYKKNPIK
jgi:hypothetical protein